MTAEPLYCNGCGSIIGESETLVRCGSCLKHFHLGCFKYRHGCEAEAREADDEW